MQMLGDYPNTTSKTGGVVVLLLFSFLFNFVVIWALNTLFVLGIAYTLKNALALWLIGWAINLNFKRGSNA